jgi:hypothetical protein
MRKSKENTEFFRVFLLKRYPWFTYFGEQIKTLTGPEPEGFV